MGKKRCRTKGISEIPTVLTANIGSETRREIESTPEVFEKVREPNPTTKIDDVLLSDSSSFSGAMVRKSSSANKVSLKKKKKSGTRRVKITKENIIEVYNVDDPMQVFSGSSGTHSYDSAHSAKSLTRHLSNSKYIESIPLNISRVEYMKPTMSICPVACKTYDEPTFSALLKSKQSPFGEFEPISVNEQQQQLIKEAVSNALTEFFDTDRDDLCLTIRVQRERQWPVMDLYLKKVPKRMRPQKNRRQNIGEKKSSSRTSSTLSSSSYSEDEEEQEDDTQPVETTNTLLEQLTSLGQITFAALRNLLRH